MRSLRRSQRVRPCASTPNNGPPRLGGFGLGENGSVGWMSSLMATRMLHPGRRTSHAGDEAVDTLVVGAERVLAQHGPLRLVVQLEVHPVDREVAPLLLRVADELAAQPCPRGLRRCLLGLVDPQVVDRAVDLAAL